MDSKVVLVAVAASGIGQAAAAGSARLGASVRALDRDKRRAAQAAAAARQKAGKNADIRPVACGLSSLAALRVFVIEFSWQEQRLDVLVHNAGVMPDEQTRTGDGLELMFAAHVLAPWAPADPLAGLIPASPGPRKPGHGPVGHAAARHRHCAHPHP